MNCLCCGKPLISKNNSGAEEKAGWHQTCVRKFFGTKELPMLDVSSEKLEMLAIASTSKGYTVPGVQKKMSLHLEEEDSPRLTLINYPAGYILKPQVEEYKSLPEAEFLVMQMAKATGIRTVPHALIRIPESGELAYITKRIDRIFEKKNQVKMLAMEDFCQLDLRLTQDKYRGSYERCAKLILKYSKLPGLDLSELFMRMVFSFVTGNADMHLKNFSMIETKEGSNEYMLSEAYDLLPVNIILPEDTEQFALTINGKKRNIHRGDFIRFAENCSIPKPSAEKIINKVVSMELLYLNMCEESYLSKELKEKLKQLILARINLL